MRVSEIRVNQGLGVHTLVKICRRLKWMVLYMLSEEWELFENAC